MSVLANVGRAIAHNPKNIALLGAGVGSAVGAGRSVLSGETAPGQVIGSALKGGIVGGALGGAGGGIARAAHDTMLLRPELKGVGEVAKATAQRAGQGVSNFAQRQFHGLTGYGSKDTQYLDRIGIHGSNVSANKAQLLNRRAENRILHGAKPDAVHADLHGAVSGLAQEGELGDRFRSLGMTSAPGAVRSLVKNPRETAGALWSQMRAGGTLGAVAGVGLPAVSTASSLAAGDESAQGGHTVGEKALRGAANVGGGLLFGGVPLIANAAASMGTEAAAGRLGRVFTPPKTIPQRIE